MLSDRRLLVVVGCLVYLGVCVFVSWFLLVGAVVGLVFMWFFKGWFEDYERERLKEKVERKRKELKDLEDKIK